MQLQYKVQSTDEFYFKDPNTVTSWSSKEVQSVTDTVIPKEYTEENYKKLTESAARYNFPHILQSQKFNSTDNPHSSLHLVNFWSVGTNTDKISFVNQETQTVKSTKEASVQTDLHMSSFPGSLLKSSLNMKPKFVCCFCQRHYSSKITYERHLRVHIKTNNRQIRAKVVLSSESINNQHFNAHNETPIIIQLPSSTKTKCDQCKKYFSSKMEKDAHNKSCIMEPFPMKKCLYCDVKFYTSGAMDEHVKVVHAKNQSPRQNSYYCVFCDESFNTGYSFHLHLDQHLAT